jgi:UDP-2,3-diacylglucosamine hydrolase
MLHRASAHLDLFIMCGNRDFLMGDRLLAACGARALPDPSVLHLGNTRWLLVHGDEQCLADVPYQGFRAQVRSAAWQKEFLNQPIGQRQALARQMRTQSEAQKKQLAQAQTPWIDLDRDACLALQEAQGADHMIHGHTHQPAQHDLGQGRMRWVLSDWDLHATPPRAEVLRLSAAAGAPQRIKVSAAQAAT